MNPERCWHEYLQAVLELKKSDSTKFDLKVVEKLEDVPTDFSKIRCPLCAWQPRPFDRWVCTNVGAPEFFFAGCGHHWNTFTTRGRCPKCSHQWRYTTCFRCKQMSLHEDWYVKDSRG
jgi:hypothetical protein